VEEVDATKRALTRAKLERTEAKKKEMEEASTHFPENHSDFATMNKLRPAAESLKAALKKSKNSNCAKGPLLHIFNRSVVLLTLAEYRAEHGGTELSHDHNIKVLEHWDWICETLQKAADALGDDTRDAVKKVIDNSKKITVPFLYTLCVLLKTQRKLEGQDVETIKDSIFEISMYWRKLYPDKAIFLKLHHLEAHVLDFIKRYGFYGRGSEEGSEAMHPEINRIFNTLRSVSNDEVKTGCMVKSYLLCLQPEFAGEVAEVEKAMTAKARGPYNVSNRPRSTLKIAIVDPIEVGNGCLQLQSGKIIKEEWLGVFLYFLYGIVPPELVRCI
jgi:hypothetical protein